MLVSAACALGHGHVVGRSARRRCLAARRGRQSQARRVALRAAAPAGQTRVKISKAVAKGADFYEVLGVSREASQEDIRSAYKRAIREVHPDLNPSPDAAEVFVQVQEAFRWLSDPQQREVYDGVGSKFGEDALYDYTDDPILGSLDQIQQIRDLSSAVSLVNMCRISLALRKAVRIQHDIKDIRKRFRKFGTERITFVKEFFCTELRQVLEYPRLIKKCHPFERLSIEASLVQHMNSGGQPFGKLLAAIKALRKKITEEASARAYWVGRAQKGRDATFQADSAIDILYELVTNHEPLFQQFRDAQYVIQKTPSIDLDKPTVVFIGAPNVGKSSLVRSLSSGRPEVNDYVYTTRKLTIGHIWHFVAGTPLLVHGQLVDTPGMQKMPEQADQQRFNLMDQLTLGSLQHLPSACVFVFDPWPVTHGLLSVQEQVKLRDALRRKFPRRPWLDVITKVDLLDELEDYPEVDENIEYLARIFPRAVQVSSLEGTGLDTLNMAVRQLLEEMTRVVRQLQRSKIRQLRLGEASTFIGKEALPLR